jgi:hypothetical protein
VYKLTLKDAEPLNEVMMITLLLACCIATMPFDLGTTYSFVSCFFARTLWFGVWIVGCKPNCSYSRKENSRVCTSVVKASFGAQNEYSIR